MGDRLNRWADPPLLVLASLAEEPKHGYAITQDVADTMGCGSAGTLYAVISRLESRGLIEPLESEDRRRPYRLTAAGARELAEQSERMHQVSSVAQRRLRANYGWGGASARDPPQAGAPASWPVRRSACTRRRGQPATGMRFMPCWRIPEAAPGPPRAWPGMRSPRGSGLFGAAAPVYAAGAYAGQSRRAWPRGRCWPAWPPSSRSSPRPRGGHGAFVFCSAVAGSHRYRGAVCW